MLARLDGFDAKSGRTRRKRYERRDDETRRCAAGRRFLFVAPFSVAHPCRQEKGIRLLFFFRPVLPLARFLVPVSSGRIVSSPSRGSVAVRASWCGRYALTGCGLIWLLVPPSRFEVRSISSYRLASGWRRAPFLSARFHHSLRSSPFVIRWRQGGSFSLSSRLSFRLLVSWGVSCYSLRLACQSVSSHRFVGVSLFRLARAARLSFIRLARLVVPRRLASAFHLAPSRAVRLARASRQAVRVLSFRLAARLGGSYGGACSLCLPSHSLLFSYYLACCVSCPWGGAAARLALALWLCVSFPVAILHRGAVAIAEMGVPFDDTEERAVLFSSFSPSRRGMK